MMRVIVIVFIVVSAFAADIGVRVPDVISRCMTQQKEKLEIDEMVNPFFLRGDIDGDRKMDHVVAVKNRSSGQLGILLCLGTGHEKLFAAGSRELPDDLILQPGQGLGAFGWTFITKNDAQNILVSKVRLGRIKGEVIEFEYEGDPAYIYWNGKRFKWAKPKQ